MIGRWASLLKRHRTKADPAAAWAALHAGNLELATDLLALCRADRHDAQEITRLAAHIRWQQHDVEAATALLEAALASQPSAPARETLEELRAGLQLPAADQEPFDSAQALNPRRAGAAIEKAAQLLLQQLPPGTALDCAEVACRAHPENAQLQYLRSQLLADAARWPEAVSALRNAARQAPTSGPVLHELGKLLARTGLQTEAIDYLELAVHHTPTSAAAWIDLMRVLDSADDLEAASDAARRFDTAIPVDAEAAFWVGKFSERLGDLAAASKAYERALRLKPQSAPIMTNYGLLLLELGRIAEANQLLSSVATAAPSDPAAQMNLGLALRFAGDLKGALGSFRAALALAPADAMTRYHLATTHLLRGEFAEGWDQYSARWQQDIADRRRPQGIPWSGSGLEGKHLLVWGEQGLGDHIMFSSCIEEVARKTQACTVECHPRLKALFERSFPWCTVVGGNTQGDLDSLARARAYDVHVPMGDLPGITRRSLADFPRHTGYLIADQAKRRLWRNRLAGLPGRIKVGISWIGGVRQTGRTRRSMALTTWAPLLSLPGIDFVSLQYTPPEPELQQIQSTLGVKIWHWQDAIDDLDETAALISELDAVISVCNTTVHLTGALGKPVWVLTPFVAEWRYLAQGLSMPWYPSAKLIRQQTPDSWEAVIEVVAENLMTKFGSHD